MNKKGLFFNYRALPETKAKNTKELAIVIEHERLNSLGLSYIADFINASEQHALLQQVQKINWQQVSLFGQTAKRRVAHFGLHYHYDKRTVQPTTPPPEWLNELIKRAAQLLHEPVAHIAELLITDYPVGAGINWHRDAAVFKDIIGISLASSSLIYFRNRANKKEQIKLMLEPGSAYVLKGDIRNDWEHRIPPVNTPRYSLTLRTLR